MHNDGDRGERNMNNRVLVAVAMLAGILMIGNYCMVKKAQAKTKQEMIDNAARHDDELERETEESEVGAVKPSAKKSEQQEQAKTEPSKPVVSQESEGGSVKPPAKYSDVGEQVKAEPSEAVLSQEQPERISDAPTENKPALATSQTAAPATEPHSVAPEKKDWWKCYIATAAYGSYLDPHVQVLRDFRDTYLLSNPAGKIFVKMYYRLSPPVADFISKHESLRTAARWTLTPVVYGIIYPLAAPSMVVVLAGGFVFYRRRIRSN